MIENERLHSLDFFRGIVMLLLVGEAAEVFKVMTSEHFAGSWLYWLGGQFHHVEWHGLAFWDLIQPSFMFIVGVAMPFSFQKRIAAGDDWNSCFGHVLKRSALLLFFGVSLHIYYSQAIVFEYWNVLSQLSFTYLLAFLIMRKPALFQIGVAIGLLVFTEAIYRNFSVAGFDQPFTAGQNFGAWFDMLIMGKLSGGHWVTFNAVPTAVHTILGVLVGQLLMDKGDAVHKFQILVVTGLLLLLAGYSFDLVTPIVKRAVTTSFVIVTSGWVLIFVAICYWVIDIKKMRKGIMIPIMVGMNSIFIYLFTNIGGAEFTHGIIAPFTKAIFSWTGEGGSELITSLAVWATLTYLCLWLYKRKIFFKL